MPSLPATPIPSDSLSLSLTPPPSRSTRIPPPPPPPVFSIPLPPVRARGERVSITRQIPLPASLVVTNASSTSTSDVLSQMRFSYASPRLTSPFSTPGSRGRSRSQSSSNSRSSRKSPASDRFSDRFIPSRANVQSFRMNCPTHLLSSEERLFRRSTSNSSRGRSVSPDGGNNPVLVNPRNNIGTSGGFRGGGINRRISAGAVGVFGIGIGAAARREEPRPRGREVHINVFGDKTTPEAELEKHEKLLSAALGVDRSARVLSFTRENEPRRDGPSRKGGVMGSPRIENVGDMLWDDVLDAGSRDSTPQNSPCRKSQKRAVPTTPFRVLDAPGLRDDYYCSLLAYSPHTNSLAVGLHSDVYSWTEAGGARPFEPWSTSHVTSLAFSCLQGGNNILAIGRIDGSLSLWDHIEPTPRIERPHNAGVACLAWKPVTSNRSLSRSGVHARPSSLMTETEELLVGDEFGNVYYYSIEWNGIRESLGPGSADATITLLRRIVVHSQQICGLAWSGDGDQFATGGNDNVACLFDASEVLSRRRDGNYRGEESVLEGGEKHRWLHGAAVKAIAFCPWQKSLVATGGGSNDRCIHFFHTFSGATLATINVSAQVTSLLWSTSHREIAATFGYANPDHPVRIAVFSWPECRQVVQIPWQEDMRALYAVAYPGGPNDPVTSAPTLASNRRIEDGIDDGDVLREDTSISTASGSRDYTARWAGRGGRPKSEGCIVVAASDETVRFHEVWSETRRGVLGWRGVLGGSDILEGLEGIEKDGGEMIR